MNQLKKKRLTDEDILSMGRVKPTDAANYLCMDVSTIYYGLQDGIFTFGVAIKNKENSKWTYDIRPEALVEYNRHGRVDLRKVLEQLEEIIKYKS